MRYLKFLFQDWKANKGNIKGRLIVTMFRFAQLVNKRKPIKVLFFWYLILYTVLVEWILCCELSWHTSIGKNFQVHHGHSLVIGKKVIIGENCILRHCTSIGSKGFNMFEEPVIGKNVSIGPNSCVIGDITIGDNAIIGYGSMVNKSVDANSIVAGNPAKLIRYI